MCGNVLIGLLVFVVSCQPGRSTTPQVITHEGKLTLTSSYCDELGATVSSFSVTFRKIKVVNPDALKHCISVKDIWLSFNEIEILDPNLFKTNVEAEELYLSVNRISYIPKELFLPLKKLRMLYLNLNPIGTLEPVLQSNLNKLEDLAIAQIGLFRLDADKVVMKLPRLKEIAFNHNNFACDTYNQLKADFERKQVKVGEKPYTEFIGQRCMDNNQWTFKYLMKIYRNTWEERVEAISELEKKIQNQTVLVKDQFSQVDAELDDLKTRHEESNQNFRNASEERVEQVFELEEKIQNQTSLVKNQLLQIEADLDELKIKHEESNQNSMFLGFRHGGQLTALWYAVGALTLSFVAFVCLTWYFIIKRFPMANKNHASNLDNLLGDIVVKDNYSLNKL